MQQVDARHPHLLLERLLRVNDGIARIIFTLEVNQMILLHAFIKKSQKTPKQELELARKRLQLLK